MPATPTRTKKVRCSSCESTFSKADFTKEELRKDPDERRCMNCVTSTQALFSTIRLSSRRTNEQSAEAEVERLRSKDAQVQADAANKLWMLSRQGDEQCDRDISASGAIGPLVELLRCREDDRAWFAAGALQSLSCRSEARKTAIVSAGALFPLVAILRTGDPEDQEVVAMALHNLSDSSGASGASALELATERQLAIVHATALPTLVGLLASGEDGCKEAVAGIIANLASSEHADVQTALAEEVCAEASAAVPSLVALLRAESNPPETRLEAARALRALSDSRDGDGVVAVARALSLETGPGAVGDVMPSSARVHEELDRLLQDGDATVGDV